MSFVCFFFGFVVIASTKRFAILFDASVSFTLLTRLVSLVFFSFVFRKPSMNFAATLVCVCFRIVNWIAWKKLLNGWNPHNRFHFADE